MTMVNILRYAIIWIGLCYIQWAFAALFVWAYPRQAAWLRDHVEKYLRLI